MSGIHTLDDLRGRCWVDEAGCWHWAGAKTGSSGGLTAVTHLPALGTVVTVPRAVLFLRGVDVPAGHIAWATCETRGCCNHVRHGTRAQYGVFVAKTGKRKGRVEARLAARMPRKTHTPPELREAILASGDLGTELSRRLGVSESVISRIRRRETYAALPVASVFAYAMTA